MRLFVLVLFILWMHVLNGCYFSCIYEMKKKTERIHVMGSVTQNKGRKRGAEKCEMKHDHARVVINATACRKCLRLSLFSHILRSRLHDDYIFFYLSSLFGPAYKKFFFLSFLPVLTSFASYDHRIYLLKS